MTDEKISSMGRSARKLIRKTAKWAAILAIPSVFIICEIHEHQRIEKSSRYYHVGSGDTFSFSIGNINYKRTIGRIRVPMGNNPARIHSYKDDAFYEVITAHLQDGTSIEYREDNLDKKLDSFELYKRIPNYFATNREDLVEYYSGGRSVEDSLKDLTPEMANVVTGNYAIVYYPELG